MLVCVFNGKRTTLGISNQVCLGHDIGGVLGSGEGWAARREGSGEGGRPGQTGSAQFEDRLKKAVVNYFYIS